MNKLGDIGPGEFRFHNGQEEKDFNKFVSQGLPSRFHSLRALFSMVWCWGYTEGKREANLEKEKLK